MGTKKMFTVPDGEKVTEKALRRVLISSVCSILLCMTCLVSATWAWFTVSIENTGNVIQIGKPEVMLTVKDKVFSSGSNLTEESNTVNIVHANGLDDLDKKSTLYVTLTIQHSGGTAILYTTLNQENQYQTEITIIADSECSLSWEASWFLPVNATALIDDTITLTAEDSAGDPTTETSMEAITEPSTESTTETTSDPAATNPSSEPAAETSSTPMDVPSDVPGNDSASGETDSITVTTEATTE